PRVVLLLSVCCTRGYAQALPGSILEIDVENLVNYGDDISNASLFATNPGIPPRNPVRNFATTIVLGDIVAVNGQAAKGTFVFHSRQLILKPAPAAGEAIADIMRNNVNDQTFEILKSDGTPLGSLMGAGLGVGSAPPGARLAVTQGNNAIVGGTGAFLGVRGQVGLAVQTSPARLASMTEDPVNRRRFGGGRSRFTLHVIPLFRPEIVNTTH